MDGTTNSIDDTLTEPGGIWSHEETLALLNAYEMYKELFESNTKSKIRKSAVWDTITAHLNEENVMKTKKQCSSKWSNLLRSYNFIAKNKRKGKVAIKFKYFDKIDELLGNRKAYEAVSINIEEIYSNNIQDDEKYDDSDLFEKVYVNASSKPPISNAESVVGEKTKRKRGPADKTQYYRVKKAFLEEQIKAHYEDREMMRKDEERRERDMLSKIEFRKKKLELLEKLVRANTTDFSF